MSLKSIATTRVISRAERAVWPEGTIEPGMGAPRVVSALFDPSANAAQRTAAPHTLGVQIPAGAIVTRYWYDVITTFASTAGGVDKATVALSVEGANDLVTATAIEAAGNHFDAGTHTAALDPLPKTTVARDITITVAVAALTAGKLAVFVEYVLAAQ